MSTEKGDDGTMKSERNQQTFLHGANFALILIRRLFVLSVNRKAGDFQQVIRSNGNTMRAHVLTLNTTKVQRLYALNSCRSLFSHFCEF